MEAEYSQIFLKNAKDSMFQTLLSALKNERLLMEHWSICLNSD